MAHAEKERLALVANQARQEAEQVRRETQQAHQALVAVEAAAAQARLKAELARAEAAAAVRAAQVARSEAEQAAAADQQAAQQYARAQLEAAQQTAAAAAQDAKQARLEAQQMAVLMKDALHRAEQAVSDTHAMHWQLRQAQQTKEQAVCELEMVARELTAAQFDRQQAISEMHDARLQLQAAQLKAQAVQHTLSGVAVQDAIIKVMLAAVREQLECAGSQSKEVDRLPSCKVVRNQQNPERPHVHLLTRKPKKSMCSSPGLTAPHTPQAKETVQHRTLQRHNSRLGTPQLCEVAQQLTLNARQLQQLPHQQQQCNDTAQASPQQLAHPKPPPPVFDTAQPTAQQPMLQLPQHRVLPPLQNGQGQMEGRSVTSRQQVGMLNGHRR
eukprot:jgi/Chrzof1/4500/Cz14g15190.t1